MVTVINEYLHKELITVNLEAESPEDIFYAMAEMLKNNGYVKDSFYNGLVERESKFPTGLLLGKYNVAIPHTDAIHVLKPTIAIATLKHPVKFNCMDGSGDVNVEIVFLLALNEPHSQIVMLQQLMLLIQDEDILRNMHFAKDSGELYDIVSKFKFEYK
ncbi:PTS sugar transporter subunit IIA [Clostridium sp. JN-9]|uniref:PTS sugar transporter subunit IIA n=1 Tax=Clostridium sp. JN-9 TaxID=2507159 RepID=UPI000FFE17BB|nr:PTS sugar transporter subunit IIA [Clostridium sp. JN-9]QAT39247.1 PTS sugar transporter subunit IIA [Clostridium sp. JN-9]